MDINELLRILKIKREHKFVLVNEYDTADANFIITHLMKQVLEEGDSKICLALLHNTIGHYHNVGKRLKYDLMKEISNKRVYLIEAFKDLTEHMLTNLTQNNSDDIVYYILKLFEVGIEQLKENYDGPLYVIIDDVSHLNELGVNYSNIMQFTNIIYQRIIDSNCNLIVCNHVGDSSDKKISLGMSYMADVRVDVSPLPTGESFDVSGLIKLYNGTNITPLELLHFKQLNHGVRVFRPGNSINYVKR